MRKKFSLLQGLGVLILVLGLGILLMQQIRIRQGIREDRENLERILDMLPEGESGIMSDYSDSEMPILQVGGKDYVCILEIPGLGVRLPVQNQWQSDGISVRSSRFWGSIYDGTLILGGEPCEGQFDFCTQVEVGTQVLLTDMQGTEFQLKVAKIDRSLSAAYEKLADEAYPLSLFVREKYDNRYVIVRCEWGYGNP